MSATSFTVQPQVPAPSPKGAGAAGASGWALNEQTLDRIHRFRKNTTLGKAFLAQRHIAFPLQAGATQVEH